MLEKALFTIKKGIDIMKKEEFDSKVTSIMDKIGQEASSLVLDDVAVLLTDNENMNKEIESKDKEIADLKKRNDTLQRVNGNLLLQVGVGQEDKPKNIEENKGRPIFDPKSCFDSHGNFIK